MRDKEVVKRDSIRAINTMIKQIEVDERRELDDEEVIKLIQRGIKQREEAITQYKAAGRDDLVQKSKNKLMCLCFYLPKQLTDEELELGMKEIITETGATSMKDMGKKLWEWLLRNLLVLQMEKRINEMVKNF